MFAKRQKEIELGKINWEERTSILKTQNVLFSGKGRCEKQIVDAKSRNYKEN